MTSKRQRGFTLLEVVTALAILVVGLGGLYSLFASNLERTTQAASRGVALEVAQSQLAQSLAKSDYQDVSGEFDIYHWGVLYKKPEKEKKGERSVAWVLYDVSVQVTWSERNAEQSLTLNTQRIGPSHEQ